jgi:replicative DNA helicase
LADKSRAATEIVDEAERSLTAAIRGAPEADDATIGGLLPKYLHALGDKAKALREGRSEEIEIGLTRLDGVLGGVRPGEVVVIAARPNVGKTVLALSIAAHAALDLNRPSAFFSLEMKRDDVIERLISARSSFTLAQLRGGQVTAKDLPALEVVAGRIAKAPLSIYDGDHGLPLLTSRIRRECTLRSLRLAAIDYLGLVDVRGSKAARWEVIGEVSRSLKILAIELNIVILVCVQINRDGDGKEPVLANLRDSGAIEQDADRVILLHGLDKGEGQSFRRVVAIVAKNRHGARGRVELLLEGSHVRFVEG